MLMSEPSKIEALPARERILLTAYRLFYRHGIRATGVDRVIAEAKVTKVTFYRHFPSKNQLVFEFLDYRHRRWMDWFSQSLATHGGNLAALVPTLREWLGDADYRGCAFINSLGELGTTVPEIADITRRHKQEMNRSIAGLLPDPRSRKAAEKAAIIGMAVDGAIVGAQYAKPAETVLNRLQALLDKL
ncbi:MAG: TetR family transcriptional regulator [gamma proteobacterium symbiont of Ctena orbiculata]|nr:TetR/AcrR family transcriptional regulator [Candidatus Thiodiazotropha taylori]MBT3059050.1 TetR/AcrR family transcriptional regulator [Candidatus Thiodiazotropha sp. (ex Lucina pensylvanica)]MBV2094781.1 TetR/AcrR family transcriptional regulator [Candidatus Thiodiazotropha sp. (ex Codakia orbicularis)]PUB73860.1 MAG: TetR family transcriptional regulator [gamma proteobacterium symbiont of Ctena orbiculata]MBT3062391.1 TetR/AcrR family transcriptional regulator [Candidatus Thiodiazotropha s